MSTIYLIGTVGYICIELSKIKGIQRKYFGNLLKVYIFISDTNYCVPVKLISIVGNLHLFSTHGQHVAENVTLEKNMLWDV